MYCLRLEARYFILLSMSVTAKALHGINVCVIPSPYNNDRPWALRHRSLAFMSAVLIATKVLAFTVIALTPAQAELSTITVDRITQLTNEERAKVGLPALTTNSQLTAAAKKKAAHMLEEDYFAHISPSGVTPWFWINGEGYSYRVAGENLAIDFTEAEDVVAAWIASPGHKANMLHTDYTETGIAVATGEFQGGTSTIVVHMFGKPASASASTPTPTATPESPPAAVTTTTPTPTPVLQTPTPTPIEITPTETTTPPPGTPRIALSAGSVAIGSSAAVQIQGDTDTIAHVLVNNQIRANVALGEDGVAVAQLDVSDLPDGELVLRVYGSDDQGNQSELSDPLVVAKDTTGPLVESDHLQFFVSPAFDTSRAAVIAPAGDYSELTYTQGDEVILPSGSSLTFLPSLEGVRASLIDDNGNATTLEKLSLAPAFATNPGSDELAAPERFNQLTRRLTAAILSVVMILLILAVVIRVRVQHPALITHATIVILLAAVMFVL